MAMKHLPLEVLALLWAAIPAQPAGPSSGIEDIDRMRAEVRAARTTLNTAAERHSMLYAWFRLLLHQGVDVSSFETIRVRLPRPWTAPDEKQCQVIDEGYTLLEDLQARLPQFASQVGTARRRPHPERPVNWPSFGGGPAQTGYTSDPGPAGGRMAWRFPVGHTWYARPTIEGERIYVASPGITTMAYCLDKRSGRLIWKARQNGTLIYETPRVSSPVVIAGNQIIVRQTGSRGETGVARNLVYIDKQSGRVVRQETIGHLDYRQGYAPLAGDGRFVVYPYGQQYIENIPALVWNLDTLMVKETASSGRFWALRVGDISGDPVLDGARIYVATDAGVLYAFSAQGHERIVWQFHARAPLRASPAVGPDTVYAAANDGVIYALDKATGKVNWTYRVHDVESRAFQFFSTPAVGGNRVYTGAANSRLYCLDAAGGKLLWESQTSDWIRARPLVLGTNVVAASMDGTVRAFDTAGKALWESRVGRHQVMADLVGDEAGVLVSGSDLYLNSLNPVDGKLQWRHSLLESAVINGRRALADMVSGGADYQSSPTVVDGVVYVGAPNRFLYAVSAASGKEIWRFETSGQVSGTPTVAEGRVYFGHQGGNKEFYAVDAATGRMVWSKPLGWVWVGASYSNGRLFVGTVEGDILCLRASTGEVLWKRETTGGIYPAPATDAVRLYTGAWGGHYFGLSQETGDMHWAFYIPGVPAGQAQRNVISPDSGAPVLLGDRLFASVGGSTFALDTRTGRRIWNHPFDDGRPNVTPATDGRQLIVSPKYDVNGCNLGSRLVSLDVQTGRKLWEFHPGGGLSGAAIAGDKICFGSSSDIFFRCISASPEQGSVPKLLWAYRLDGIVEESCPAIYGNRIFFLAADGYLYALE
jgi:outer membrane protein assembly factor BamB